MSEALYLNPKSTLEAEIQVLGSLLLDPGIAPLVINKLTTEHFSVDSHRKMYAAMAAMAETGHAINCTTVASALETAGQLEECGGVGAIRRLMESCFGSVAVEGYVDLVHQRYDRQRLWNLLKRLTKQVEHEPQPTNVLLGAAMQSLAALASESQSGIATRTLADCSMELYDAMESFASKPSGTLLGMATGIRHLDESTDGLQRKDLVLLAARPSMGKTALATQIALNIARRQELPVLFCSLEMSQLQLTQRIYTQITGIPLRVLRTGQLSVEQSMLLANAMEAADRIPLRISETNTSTTGQIRLELQRLAIEGFCPAVVVVDYLQLMSGTGDNRVHQLSQITRDLKLISKEFNCCILALSQLSRNVEQRNNKRPMLSDLRDSGALEQDADLVLMLYRESYYEKDCQMKHITELLITKHRNGETGTCLMAWDGSTTTFKTFHGVKV